ncbi:hypothetical protein G7Y89_g6452 [Cudoniella acicularis]|uniref:Uncharacterized protein n=1 Tax=Cudoniella acicularis TaxID=354080 RepID=A0A8H4W5H9_9HELO|nr:hypothetical protein G7Y89_g6452 [Cudoniella acicularis]
MINLLKTLAILVGVGLRLTSAYAVLKNHQQIEERAPLEARNCPDPCTSTTVGQLVMSPNSFSPPGGCDSFCVGTNCSQVCVSMPCGVQLEIDYRQITGFTYNPNDISVWIGTTPPTVSNPGTIPAGLPFQATTYCNALRNGETAQCLIPLTDMMAQTGSPICPQSGKILYYIITEAGMLGGGGVPAGTALGSGIMIGATGCNRWGWYFAPTPAQLTAGISGTIYVGAGGNDITKGLDAGTWSAQLVGNSIVVTYLMYNGNGPDGQFYTLSQVHVYASCAIPTKCAPGGYTYVSPVLNDTVDTTLTASIPISPLCAGNYYLIFHAAVYERALSSATCGTPASRRFRRS